MMRVFSLTLPLALAYDLTFYSDENCATPSTEIKGKLVMPGAPTGDAAPDVKFTLGRSNIGVTSINACTEFGEPFTIKGDTEGSTETKFAFGKVSHCSEYGTSSLTLYTKDMKDCKPAKAEEIAASSDKAMMTLGGFTSTCQQVFPGKSSTSEAEHNRGGMSYWASPSEDEGADGSQLETAKQTKVWSVYGKEKPITYYKIDCNPAPGDVWAIVLSTLAIVFAGAGIGLAVVAKGK